MKMKTLTMYVLTVFIGTGIFSGCSTNGEGLLEGFTEGVVLNVNTDIFRVPLAVQFLNVNQESSLTPENLVIAIEGPDSDLVYATDGNKELTVVNGILEIAFDREVLIDKDHTKSIRVVAEAPGFLKTVHNFLITDTAFQIVPVKMAAINDLPTGGTSVAHSFASGTEGLNEDVSFETEEAVEKEEITRVEMETGTKVLDENNNELVGMVQAQLVHFDNRSEESLAAFPGGLVASSVVDENGNDLGTTQFITAGFVSLDMFVGDQEVKTFSEPLEVRVGINPNTLDPETGAKLRVGDQLPVWSLDEDEGRWQYEGDATIGASADGKMEAVFEITHLSWWNVASINSNTCSASDPITFEVSSNFNGNCQSPIYYAELINTSSLASVGAGKYVRISNGNTFEFSNVPSDQEYQIKFYNLEDASCRESIITVSLPSAINCNETYTLNLTGLNFSLFHIEATMSGICQGGSTSLQINPDFIVYYRPSGCNNWNYLNNAVSGFFCSSNLEQGGTYDFKVNYGSSEYLFDGVVIASQTLLFNGATLEITIDPSGNGASLNFQDIVLPEDFCDQLLGG